MIMVESRFRIANGMDSAVRTAFLNRPGYVDGVSGFLAMEVYTASDDPAVFHLVTRWTDRVSYETWHRSDAHHHSHAFIPRGLKLDPAFTRVTVLDLIQTPSDVPPLLAALSRSAHALAEWTVQDAAAALVVSLDDETCVIGDALARRVGIAASPAIRLLASVMSAENRALLASRLLQLRSTTRRGTDEVIPVAFDCGDGSSLVLDCHVDVQPSYAVFVSLASRDVAISDGARLLAAAAFTDTARTA